MGETETKTAAGASGGGARKKPFSHLFFRHCVRSLSSVRGGGRGEGPKGQWDPIIAERNCPLEAHCDCGIEKHGEGAGDRTVSVVTCNFALFRSRPERREREKGMSRSSTTLGVDFPKGANGMKSNFFALL